MIDFVEPPKLWMPERPAIIHPGIDLARYFPVELDRHARRAIVSELVKSGRVEKGAIPFGMFAKQSGIYIKGSLATTQTSAGVNRNINIPSSVVAAGNLIIAILTTSNGSAQTLTAPSTFSVISGAASSNTNTNISAFYKFASGSEGGTTVTSSVAGSPTNSVALCFVIGGNHASTPPEAAVTSGSSSSTPDPPSLTASWGSAANLWLALMGRRSTSVSLNSYPTDYNLSQDGDNASTCYLYGAGRLLTAATENPGAFSLTNANVFAALTIVARPA